MDIALDKIPLGRFFATFYESSDLYAADMVIILLPLLTNWG